MVLLLYLNRAWDDPPLGHTRKRMILALARELEKRGSTVLCIDRPLFPLPDMLARPLHAARSMLKKPKIIEAGDNVFLFKPWAPTHYILSDGCKILQSVNRAVLRSQVRRAFGKLPHGPRVSWVFHPYQSQCLGLAGEKLTVYEAYDDYAALAGEKRAGRIKAAEDTLLKRVDVVLTTSRALYEDKKVSNPNTHLVPNGVDFDLFSQAAEERTEVAETLRDLSHPILGFVGKINEKIDFELVNSIAYSKPDWNLVFIGPNDGSPAFNRSAYFLSAKRKSNIRFTGAVPYESLPSFMKAFDACLLPNAVNELTAGVYPLKINEYLASGKPAVSTRFGNLHEFEKVICIANTKDDFPGLIEKALNENTPELAAKRQALAKGNSWAVRAKAIADIIEENMRNRE